jgi:hypothetical protein
LLQSLVIIVAAWPAWAQYAGPAILSRGEVPLGMRTEQISFRPFLEINGIYDTGLTGVGVVDARGDLAHESAEGIEATGGISGSHRWKHTTLGLDYKGSIRHYTKKTYYDGTDQSLDLGISHQFSRRTELTLRESAGLFSRDFGLLSLRQAVPFDPSASYIPTTDFFDNRTLYASSQADLTYLRTARLSFNVGGDAFVAKRRSAALYGITGQSARGDVQYRLARHTTVGANYTYARFDFSRGFGGTDVHSVIATYSVRFSRAIEFSGYGGVARAETKFIQVIPLDPVIAAIIGQASGFAIQHRVNTIPNLGGRLSRTFRNGVFSINGSHAVNPGNGLFLTSVTTSVSGNYSYTGLRRWSFSTGVYFSRSEAVSNVDGEYSGVTGTLGLSRQIANSVHLTAHLDARKYTSGDFSRYNRVIYRATIGMGFSPGDVPLRIW